MNKFGRASPAGDSFYLLHAARHLSYGFVETDQILYLARIELGNALFKVQRPNDYASFYQRTTLLQKTTFIFCNISVHRNLVRRRCAMLAPTSESECEMIIPITEALLGRPMLRNSAHLLKDIEHCDHTWSVGGSKGYIGAITLPRRGEGRAIGAVNLVLFWRASTREEIAENYLDPLKSCVIAIEMRHRLNSRRNPPSSRATAKSS